MLVPYQKNMTKKHQIQITASINPPITTHNHWQSRWC